ncbi:hypothetical protein JHW45_12785 [Paracoccus stylophorae]|uniref:Uncharacterized protein n=1 Tax=Paracoccus stylophorae TaxID=659350 RepID=A0ABY7SST2_9RHOB|nr:hypothetical protein [Paracoccus stylophorae]WCR09941.1 hypothetical protein JHW45_12785 [Paracoccus stylophorae]
MSDYLLLAGVALCVISVVVAIVQLVQTHPPRTAAIILILGIAAIFASAWLDPEPLRLRDVPQAWNRVVDEARGAVR